MANKEILEAIYAYKQQREADKNIARQLQYQAYMRDQDKAAAEAQYNRERADKRSDMVFANDLSDNDYKDRLAQDRIEKQYALDQGWELPPQTPQEKFAMENWDNPMLYKGGFAPLPDRVIPENIMSDRPGMIDFMREREPELFKQNIPEFANEALYKQGRSQLEQLPGLGALGILPQEQYPNQPQIKQQLGERGYLNEPDFYDILGSKTKGIKPTDLYREVGDFGTTYGYITPKMADELKMQNIENIWPIKEYSSNDKPISGGRIGVLPGLDSLDPVDELIIQSKQGELDQAIFDANDMSLPKSKRDAAAARIPGLETDVYIANRTGKKNAETAADKAETEAEKLTKDESAMNDIIFSSATDAVAEHFATNTTKGKGVDQIKLVNDIPKINKKAIAKAEKKNGKPLNDSQKKAVESEVANTVNSQIKSGKTYNPATGFLAKQLKGTSGWGTGKAEEKKGGSSGTTTIKRDNYGSKPR
ncbi:hypothetical protein [Sulfuricurvum sp.]|uniref:hypothetical protein n=1 Tax=Sulfuricurvum sp. TaxID=2025608 RepID=UPI003569476F